MMRTPLALIAAATLLVGCPENQINPIVDDTSGVDTGEDDTGVDDTGGTDIPDDVLTGGIMGRICAPSQNVYVADAKVSIEHEWGVSSTYTDEDGFFILRDVPSGTYVVVVTKGSFSTQFEVYIPPNEIIELAEEECFEDDLNIAVITGEYDNIGRILSDLGFSYDVYNGLTRDATDFLRDPSLMDEYDIIFMNCGLTYDFMNPSYMDEVGGNVRNYVASGGSVYASDWAYYIAERSYPDMVDYRGNDSELWAPARGARGEVAAEVLDSSMITALGGQTVAQINFDLDIWVTPVGTGGGASTMVYSRYRYWNTEYSATLQGEGPLAIRLENGEGALIYTSFHNEAQATLDMETLLREIIFAL